MATNTLLTIDMITREAMRLLQNNLVLARHCTRDLDAEFGIKGKKIGTAVRVRMPQNYTVRSGATYSAQNDVEQYETVTIDKQKGVDLEWTSAEMAMSLDEFSKNKVDPAMRALANQVDSDIAALYKYFHNSTGTPGTTPATALVWSQARSKLLDSAAPKNGLVAVMTPLAEATMVDALKGLTNSAKEITKQYEDGNLGRMGGLDWSMDQNLVSHTVGPLGGTPLVNGASQTGTSLITDGWTAAAASRLKAGDVFTIAGVNKANPVTGADTGILMQFVVDADVSSDGSGNLTATIHPGITTSGAYKTVSASPADNAAITVVGAANTVTPQNLILAPGAIALAFVDLPVPGGTDRASIANDPMTGMSIRLVRDYDIDDDLFKTRFDVMYGVKAVRRSQGARVHG